MLVERWAIYQSVHKDASKHTFYAGSVAVINELIPLLSKQYNDVPPELIKLFNEINNHFGKIVIPILKDK